MAKRKKKITILSDCPGANVMQFYGIRLGDQPVQRLEIRTVDGDHPCSVCGQKAHVFWTVNAPFVTEPGDETLPAFALVCRAHSPITIDQAGDYEPPEGEDKIEWLCGCGSINPEQVNICPNCESDKNDKPPWPCECGTYNSVALLECKECGLAKPEEQDDSNEQEQEQEQQDDGPAD